MTKRKNRRNKKQARKPKGWRNEPGRHALAARGVRTRDKVEKQLREVREGEFIHEVEKNMQEIDHPQEVKNIYIFLTESDSPLVHESEELHIWIEVDEHFFELPPQWDEEMMNEKEDEMEKLESFYEMKVQSLHPRFERVRTSIKPKNPYQYDMDRQDTMWKKRRLSDYIKVYERGD